MAPNAVWSVEVKDYRVHERTKPSDIADEVAAKARDTLSGLAAASANAINNDEKEFAKRALGRHQWRVALHLEQSAPTASALLPRVIDDAKALQKLRGRLRAVDAKAIVVNRQTSDISVPWTVA